MGLIVNIDEFSELCGVTAETMRGYIKAVEGNPAWLIERGSRGREYRIEAEGGIAWWRELREGEEIAEAGRKEQLQQLRMELIGEQAEGQTGLALSGRQRREEYGAAVDRIKLRRMMGELVERLELEDRLSHAAVECRRRLMQVPAEFAVKTGIPVDEMKPLYDLLEKAVDAFVTALELPASGKSDA